MIVREMCSVCSVHIQIILTVKKYFLVVLDLTKRINFFQVKCRICSIHESEYLFSTFLGPFLRKIQILLPNTQYQERNVFTNILILDRFLNYFRLTPALGQNSSKPIILESITYFQMIQNNITVFSNKIRQSQNQQMKITCKITDF